MLPECKFSDTVEKFIGVVNLRLNSRIRPGSTWVRIQPPYDWELADNELDCRYMPFTRVGILATVEEVYYLSNGTELVDIRVGPWLMAYGLKLFKQLYIRCVNGNEFTRPPSGNSNELSEKMARA